MSTPQSNDVVLYVKKPLPVRAFQYTHAMIEAHLFDKQPLPACLSVGSASYHAGERRINHCNVYCKTLENEHLRVKVGDWILGPGAGGEFWPVQDEIFRATYQPYDKTALEQVPKCTT